MDDERMQMLARALGAVTVNPLMQRKVASQREAQFQAGIRATPWFSEFEKRYGEEPDLNTKDYDYRAAWAAGARPKPYEYDQGQYHWPSSIGNQMFKSETHPTMWKQRYLEVTGQNPDAVGATQTDWLRMQFNR